VVRVIQRDRLFVHPEAVLRLPNGTASVSPLFWLEEDRVNDYWKSKEKVGSDHFSGTSPIVV
jgi:hypothetical protein